MRSFLKLSKYTGGHGRKLPNYISQEGRAYLLRTGQFELTSLPNISLSNTHRMTDITVLLDVPPPIPRALEEDS